MSEFMTINERRIKYVGKRVRCIFMNDDHPVEPNTEGTVTSIDDIGTLHVMWDNGRTFGLVPKEDEFVFI